MDSIPNHRTHGDTALILGLISDQHLSVKWETACNSSTFMYQSAHLHACYYMLQITVHRPFIPAPRRPSSLSFPSLTICTNAARSCVNVLYSQYLSSDRLDCHHRHQVRSTVFRGLPDAMLTEFPARSRSSYVLSYSCLTCGT